MISNENAQTQSAKEMKANKIGFYASGLLPDLDQNLATKSTTALHRRHAPVSTLFSNIFFKGRTKSSLTYLSTRRGMQRSHSGQYDDSQDDTNRDSFVQTRFVFFQKNIQALLQNSISSIFRMDSFVNGRNLVTKTSFPTEHNFMSFGT